MAEEGGYGALKVKNHSNKEIGPQMGGRSIEMCSIGRQKLLAQSADVRDFNCALRDFINSSDTPQPSFLDRLVVHDSTRTEGLLELNAGCELT